MSTNLSGGDPRFGPADPAPGSGQPAPGGSTGFDPAAVAPNAFATPQTSQAVPPPRPATPQRYTTGTPRWLVASAVTVIALLVLTAAMIWQNQSESDAKNRAVFEHTRVSTPATALGLQQGVGPGMESAQTRLNLSLARGGAVDPVYAAYIDSDGNSYAVVAGARRVTSSGDLDSAARSTAQQFSSGIGSAGSAPFTVSEVAAGELGGVMLCGATEIAQLPSTYCVAVDEGSVTEFLVATGDVTEGAKSASGLRLAVVTRTA